MDIHNISTSDTDLQIVLKSQYFSGGVSLNKEYKPYPLYCMKQEIKVDLEDPAISVKANPVKVEKQEDRDEPTNNKYVGVILVHVKQETEINEQAGEELKRKCKLDPKLLELQSRPIFYQCSHCEHTFRKANDLLHHARVHFITKPFECRECGNAFKRPSDLGKHLRQSSEEFFCCLCCRAFNTSEEFKKHKLVQSCVRKFKCRLCHMYFSQSCDLRNHLKVHSSYKKYPRNQCDTTFSLVKGPTKSLKVHSTIKKTHCTQCDKSLTPKNLIYHLKLHSGIQPLKCGLCNETFSDLRHLSSHVRFHARSK